MSPIRTLAFVVNADKDGAAALARELLVIAHHAGVKTKHTTRLTLPRGWLRGCDACCVIGGDFRVDYRAMLTCSTGPHSDGLALNDVLLKDTVNSRLVRLEVIADGELVTDYLCDGLIFTTPTGSTAYNLSAGGPIMHPAVAAIAMTPICPHTLSNRSIIFREEVKLKVINRTAGSRLLVAMDGQRNLKVSARSPVEISVAKVRVPLAQRADYSHFSVVRTKLKWNGELAEKK